MGKKGGGRVGRRLVGRRPKTLGRPRKHVAVYSQLMMTRSMVTRSMLVSPTQNDDAQVDAGEPNALAAEIPNLPSETMTDSDTETLPAEAWEIQASLRNLKEQEEEKEKRKKKEEEALAARVQCHMEQEALAARLQRHAARLQRHTYDDRHFVTFMTEWTTRMRFAQQREHARMAWF